MKTHKLQSIILESKKSLRLSLPLICSQLIYASSGIITTMMIAHLGQKELATNVLVWGIYIALISVSFGTLRAPKLGLVGIGYGMALSITVSLVIIFCYLHFSKKARQYRIFSNFCQFNSKFLFELIRIGWPLGSMYCIEMALFAAI